MNGVSVFPETLPAGAVVLQINVLFTLKIGFSCIFDSRSLP